MSKKKPTLNVPLAVRQQALRKLLQEAENIVMLIILGEGRKRGRERSYILIYL